MLAASPAAVRAVRADVTRERLRALFREIAKSAPAKRRSRIYVVGGGTAVLAGWRPSSVDADLYSEDEAVFRDIQRIKERLDVTAVVEALRAFLARFAP